MHERVHVRDGDPHLDGAAAERLRDRELIEIARVVVVDRAHSKARQITNPQGRGVCRISGGGGRVDVPEFGGYRIREGRQQAPLDHRPLGDTLQDGTVLPIGLGCLRHGSGSHAARVWAERVSPTQVGVR